VILLLVGLSLVASLVAAAAAILAALWARSVMEALDGLAALTLPLLTRVKQKVDPDPMVATVVAAAAAAPPPAILERAAAAAPPAAAAPLPVIVTDDEDEPRESAPVVEPDEHSPTVPMTAPRSHAEPPETGPSRSGERVREDADERAAGCFTAYVVPPEPPVSDLLPWVWEAGVGAAAAAAERRRRAHELGQATERRRQLEARRKREAEQVARQVGVLSEEEAARPSGEDFAMDRPSWEGRTAVHDKASLEAAMAQTAAAPIGRVVPGGAARGPGEAPHPAPYAPPPPAPRPAPPPPPGKPRARADSSPTLTSQGVVRGPRQRFDPRAEPESRVDVTSPGQRRCT
jgi:hypothetical protein